MSENWCAILINNILNKWNYGHYPTVLFYFYKKKKVFHPVCNLVSEISSIFLCIYLFTFGNYCKLIDIFTCSYHYFLHWNTIRYLFFMNKTVQKTNSINRRRRRGDRAANLAAVPDEGGHHREHQQGSTQQDDRRLRVPRSLLL